MRYYDKYVFFDTIKRIIDSSATSFAGRIDFSSRLAHLQAPINYIVQ